MGTLWTQYKEVRRDYCSESVVVVRRSLARTDLELDLGAFSKFFDGNPLGMLALNFCKDVEVGIELLRIVLVGVCAKLVVVNRCVLPLFVRLDIEKFHERVELDFVEFISQVFAMHKVLILHGKMGKLLHRRILFLFNCFLLTAFFFGSLFFTFSFFFTAFFLFFLFVFLSLGLSCLGLQEFSVGLVTGKHRSLLGLLKSNEGVICGPGLLNNWLQQLDVVEGNSSTDLIVSNEGVFVVGHVQRREQGIHKVIEVVIRLMHKHGLSLFGKIAHISELDVVRRDTNISHEVSHFTICCLIQVSEDTVLELRVMYLRIIISNFLINGNFEGGLVSEDILKLRLINGHPLLICVVELCALESVPIFAVEVLLLAQVRELCFNVHECHLVEEVAGELVAEGAVGVADLVDEGLLLAGGESAEEGHQILEALLLLLQLLVLRLREQVQHLDQPLELLRVGGALGQQLLVEVVLVVELGDLGLLVNHRARVPVPVLPGEGSEKIKLILAPARLG